MKWSFIDLLVDQLIIYWYIIINFYWISWFFIDLLSIVIEIHWFIIHYYQLDDHLLIDYY